METVLKCDRRDCGKEGARWSPVLLLFAPMDAYEGRTPVAAQAQLVLKVCDACKETCDLSDFMSDEGFAQIAEQFAAIGRAIPDRSLTQLDWVEWFGSHMQLAEAARKSAATN